MTTNKAHIELACQMVYEHYTGKCWHYTKLHKGVRVEVPQICEKCRAEWTIWCPPTANPPLATSRDAWAEHIWPVMFPNTHFAKWPDYFEALMDALGGWDLNHVGDSIALEEYGAMLLQAEPIHHIEASLKAAGLWDKFKEGCK